MTDDLYTTIRNKARMIKEFKQRYQSTKMQIQMHKARYDVYKSDVQSFKTETMDVYQQLESEMKKETQEFCAKQVGNQRKALEESGKELMIERGYLKGKMEELKREKQILKNIKIMDMDQFGRNKDQNQEESAKNQRKRRETDSDSDDSKNEDSRRNASKKRVSFSDELDLKNSNRRKRRETDSDSDDAKNEDSRRNTSKKRVSFSDELDSKNSNRRIRRKTNSDYDESNEVINTKLKFTNSRKRKHVKESVNPQISNKKRRISNKKRPSVRDEFYEKQLNYRPRSSSGFKPPRHVKDKSEYNKFKKQKRSDGPYIDTIKDNEQLDITTSDWFFLINFVKSRNKIQILKDERMMNAILTADILKQILLNFEAFKFDGLDQDKLIDALSTEECLLYSILKDIKNVWKCSDNNNDDVCIGRINRFEALTFEDTRADEDFNVYIKQIDERKVNKDDQLSFLNVSKLEIAQVTGTQKYNVFIGCDKYETLTNPIINSKYKKLREKSLFGSTAIRLKIYFNHIAKMQQNYNTFNRYDKSIGKLHGCEYKAIIELIYYLGTEKVPVYYFAALNTTS